MKRRADDHPDQACFILTGHPEPIRLGKNYLLNGKPYRVGLLNFCRARLDPCFRVRREIVSRLHDIHRTIYATPPSQNMCNSVNLPPILDV